MDSVATEIGYLEHFLVITQHAGIANCIANGNLQSAHKSPCKMLERLAATGDLPHRHLKKSA
eukprot:1161763-Pelagomonas_calceolata.AAC.2